MGQTDQEFIFAITFQAFFHRPTKPTASKCKGETTSLHAALLHSSNTEQVTTTEVALCSPLFEH